MQLCCYASEVEVVCVCVCVSGSRGCVADVVDVCVVLCVWTCIDVVFVCGAWV